MTVSELANLLLTLGLVAFAVTATVEFLVRIEDRARADPAPKGWVLRNWLAFSGWFGQDLKAMFWSIVATETMLLAGQLDIRGEGWALYVVTAGWALAAYAVAAKIGYDLFWKALRAKFERGLDG